MPFTNKCARYLLLSKNRFKVCWGDSLKFFDNEMTKNSMMFMASATFLPGMIFISTCKGLIFASFSLIELNGDVFTNAV